MRPIADPREHTHTQTHERGTHSHACVRFAFREHTEQSSSLLSTSPSCVRACLRACMHACVCVLSSQESELGSDESRMCAFFLLRAGRRLPHSRVQSANNLQTTDCRQHGRMRKVRQRRPTCIRLRQQSSNERRHLGAPARNSPRYQSMLFRHDNMSERTFFCNSRHAVINVLITQQNEWCKLFPPLHARTLVVVVVVVAVVAAAPLSGKDHACTHS